jgi:hypothetical protein
MKKLPSKEYLLECFDYKPETGELFWKKRPPEHFDHDKKAWMYHKKRFSGKLAGYIKTNPSTFNIGLDYKYYERSHLIWKIETGIDPVKPIYRINKNYLDDRFDNLSLFKSDKNIFYDKRKAKFIPLIFVNKINNYLGSFDTKDEALKSLNEAKDKIIKGCIGVGVKRTNETGFKGVVKYVTNKSIKYRAAITYDGQRNHLGFFNTQKEASDAYQKAKKEIENGLFISTRKHATNKTGITGVHISGNKFFAMYKGKYIATFNTAQEAHEAYLSAKNQTSNDEYYKALKTLMG